MTADAPDPRSNLPFSAYFLSKQVDFGSYTGTTPLYADRHLVRGGMGQGTAGGVRSGGQFLAYFMMNPQTIAVSYAVDTSSVTPTFSQGSYANSQPVLGGSGNVMGSTLSFEIIFNRMYEVWRGDTPGPSDIGCRWDVRAIERLMGILDNIDAANPTGSYGAALPYPVAVPVQCVFGTQNSVIFNGIISSFSYTYTLFSADMIPIECYADISLLLQYQANGMDIINAVNNVPSDYYSTTASTVPVVSSTGPLSTAFSGFLGATS